MTEPEFDPQDDLLNIHRWVRIMCDSLAEGVWDIEGRGCTVEALPVPEPLRQQILTWQDDFDALEDLIFEGETVDWSQFAQTGLEIAREVKKALPDWTVIYHDQIKAQAQRGQPLCRDEFEYEVFL